MLPGTKLKGRPHYLVAYGRVCQELSLSNIFAHFGVEGEAKSGFWKANPMNLDAGLSLDAYSDQLFTPLKARHRAFDCSLQAGKTPRLVATIPRRGT
jgi:hypothetical protein